MGGGLLDISEHNPSIEGLGNERVAQRVRADLLADPSLAGQSLDDAGSGMPIKPGPVKQDGPWLRSLIHESIDRAVRGAPLSRQPGVREIGAPKVRDRACVPFSSAASLVASCSASWVVPAVCQRRRSLLVIAISDVWARAESSSVAGHKRGFVARFNNGHVASGTAVSSSNWRDTNPSERA